MADTLTFEPGEFEMIEEFQFEEEIQRPEELRFFTLDEQLLDYFEKVLPLTKTITKNDYKRIATEVERIRELYIKTVTVTDSDYVIDLSRKSLSLPWIKHIYSDFELGSYSFAESWSPLYTPESIKTPNFYPRMLTALPRPYRSSAKGKPITEKTIMVDSEGKNEIVGLGVYKRTKTVIHEDGSMSILPIPIGNTEDELKTLGFFLEDRGVDIPNPMVDHPFLSMSKSRNIFTEQSLLEAFPKVEAILTHGVPVTKNPYVEGQKYLKVYDIKLADIPWKVWKDKFPQEDNITANKTEEGIKFPGKPDRTNPSESLQERYIVPWSEGLDPRFWLMKQEDNGRLVVKMVLSNAHESGLVPPELPGHKPEPSFPKSTPEECFVVDSFEKFVESGVYSAKDKTCIPVSYFEQQRALLVSKGRSKWDDDILRDHQNLLKKFQYVSKEKSKIKYDVVEGHEESELRRDVRAILGDPDRLPEDKAQAIEKIVRNLAHTNKIYVDKNSAFVICSHTLAELNGDLEHDWRAFYEEWTSIDEGFRSCTYCGQQLSGNVLVAQDDFDQNGNAVINADVLPTQDFHGESHMASFTTSLNQLKSVFVLDNAGESTLYLLLSLLQVLPTESQVLPIIQLVRGLSGLLAKNKKIEKADKERLEGIFGLCGIIILLQTHNPFLIPRRSFGSKILKLTGYPRDTEDPEDSDILNVLISVLKTTVESTPNTFKGPSSTLFKAIINKPKEIKKETLNYLSKAFVPKFKEQLVLAKERYDAVPQIQEVSNVISLPLLPIKKQEYETSERIGAEELASECAVYTPKSFISGRALPNVTQEPVELRKCAASRTSEKVVSNLKLFDEIDLSKESITENIKLGFPKITKFQKIKTFVDDKNTDGIALLSLLNRILDILSNANFSIERIFYFRQQSTYLRTNINLELLRSASKGLIYELFQEISKSPQGIINIISNAIQRDLPLNMLLLTFAEAEKQNIELKAKERETFKMRMRQMDDTQRQITKMLLDIGLAGYIITNEDREFFAQEYNITETEKVELDPEEGEDGEVPQDYEGDALRIAPDGHEIEGGNGGYGENFNELGDYNIGGQFLDGEGNGV